MGSLLPLLPSSSASHQNPPSNTKGEETGPGTASVVDPKTHANVDIGGVEIATAEGVATGAGTGAGVKNAKRRKMDKKKAKREEQKSLAAEETVDVVEFKLFSRQPVKLISLLPAQEPSWHVPNPRHIPLSEEEIHRLREKIKSVAVDAADVCAAAAGGISRARGTAVERVYVVEGKDTTTTSTTATTTANHMSKKKPATPSSSSKPSAVGSATVTAADPVREALKRSAMHRKQRAAVHVVFTANAKPLPSHTPAAAQALALALGRTSTASTNTNPTGQGSGKVPFLEATSVEHGSMGPKAVGCVQEAGAKENKERKAHLRRVARRVSRFTASAASTTTTTTNAGPSTAYQGPWTRPCASNTSFFAAPEEVGGKSAGYGYGYAASLPGVREREAAGRRKGGLYVRDRMR
ncbi:hypothetical protein QFC24_006378 [Naganishia onofrii]|uniref:Uncharacterized protein n=1 Tax=Naganishia onofrii TaxID=1851511 RepID=A0ACC2X2N9_9TREE|nr:hypothetical protein QFC24_006378 [Naganishia onofrii]